MIHAVLPRRRPLLRALLAGALALGVCGALGAGPARAATPAPSAVTCSGHVDRGVPPAPPEQIDYAFGCSGDITSYTIVSSAPVGGFDVGATVFEHATDTVVEADGLFCEGLIPGDGFNCTGHATAGKDVKGAFELSAPLCGGDVPAAPLRVHVVVADVNGATAGPFRLRGPVRCAKGADKPKKPAKHHRKHRHHRRHR